MNFGCLQLQTGSWVALWIPVVSPYKLDQYFAGDITWICWRWFIIFPYGKSTTWGIFLGNRFYIFWWFLKQIHDNLQQIFESDVQNPQNTTLTKPWICTSAQNDWSAKQLRHWLVRLNVAKKWRQFYLTKWILADWDWGRHCYSEGE